MAGRVQVQDLAAPEAIRPFGVQSDTYARPAQAPINNDMEQLARGLSAFSSGMGQLARRMERDAEKEAKADLDAHEKSMEEQYAKWRVSASSDQIVKAWRDGAVPGQYDPIMTKFMQKARAGDEAEQFGRDLNSDPEFIAKVGTEDFDVDAYLQKKVEPYVKRLGNEPGHLFPFSQHFERTRELAQNTHRENLSKLRTAQVETAAMGEISRTIDAGAAIGVAPDGNFSEDVRELYKVLGPRMKGGAADIRYDRLDDLLLEVLEEKVSDPATAANYAQYAIGLLNDDRVSLDGTTRLGPLKDVPAHQDKVLAIRNKALKALGAQTEQQYRDAAKADAIAKFERRDGSFQGIMDSSVENMYDATKPIDIKAEALKKEAAAAWLEGARQNGIDLPREIETMRKNDVQHPQFFGQLEAGFTGISGLEPKNAQSPEQIAKVIQMGTLYEDMTLGGAEYVRKNLGQQAREFYEGYAALRKYKYPDNPEQAAAAMIRTQGTAQANADPNIIAQQGKEIGDRVRRINAGAFFRADIRNPQDLYPEVEQLSKTLMKTNGFSSQEAVDTAVQIVKDRSVNLNGRVVFGVSGFTQAEVPAAQAILQATFAKQSAVMKTFGVNSASDLSLGKLTDGTMYVVTSAGDPVLDDKRRPLTVNVTDFQTVNTDLEKQKADHAAEIADKVRKGEVGPRWAPHNAIRGLFGYDPN